MKEIQLTKGYTAIVDDEDYEELSKYRWRTHLETYTSYVVRAGLKAEGKRHSVVLMHRQIMDCPSNMVIDHINHNGLDNRKENLRICTRAENSMNTIRKQLPKYKFKGVCHMGGKRKEKPYAAQIFKNQKKYHIGCFATPEEAARAYDKKALELFGQYAQLNYPLNT